MAAFNRETDLTRLDYQLMVHAPVRLVHDRALLDTAVAWLRRHGYHVVVVDASWLITAHMFRDLGSALGFVCHDQWHCLGEGLDEALAESWNQTTGFALVLTGFDVFARHHLEDAHILLEVIAERAWPAALVGRRLLCLVQSDDPALRLRRIGLWTLPWFDHDRPHRSEPGNSQ
ncbi:hypothetical protein O7627_27565 [Solwaraspora sp. WMMD1047]|uniref:hypothetical protein n=1 Tax=Solwaraspora sp. WMMD1047 TaxID=3016102 RepID=UPI0024173F77|nr:hypothetical protein [Solwaraspora sp. WMMD1047]MDG4833036.1 hypothetical protein [Solwaraspora sp. WMMD1047]